MGYTKDLWTRPEKQSDGKTKRVPNPRWGKGKRWLACWLDPEDHERSKAFKVKTLADKHWRDKESDRDRGEYYDAKAGKANFEGLGKRWLASRVVDPSTRIKYEQVYRLHVEPTFGKRQVKAIKPSEVQAFFAQPGERFGASTVMLARLVLLGILDLAVADDLIRKNPVKSSIVQAVSAKGQREKVQAWGVERVFAVIDAHPESLRLLPTIGATAGLREGELFGLALEDIDYDEKVIRVRRQLKTLGKYTVYALPKNDRERVVPMADWTAECIRMHVAKFGTLTCTLPWEKPGGKERTHNLLQRWIGGGHMKSRAYSETAWKPALVAAGVIPEPTKDARGRRRYVTTRREGTHQLRHHYASVQLADGVNIRELADYLGHHDPGYTLAIYNHLLPDSHDRARTAIDRRMFRPRAVSDGT
jgi:integrase